MLNQTVPLAAAVSTRRLLADAAALAVVASTASYFFQAPVRAAVCAVACTVAPSALANSRVMGPLKSGLALA